MPSRAPSIFLPVFAAIVAGLLVPVAVLSWDIRETLFNTDRWVETTGPVIEDDGARQALSLVLVDRSADALDCSNSLVSSLVSSKLGAAAQKRLAGAVEGELGGGAASGAWETANRSAHRSFVRLTKTDSVSGNDRLLDIAVLLDAVGGALGKGDSEAGDADADAATDADEGCGSEKSTGSAPILDPDALDAAATTARVLHDVRWMPLALLMVIVVLLAMAVTAGRDMHTRIRSGVAFGFVAAGVGVLAWLLVTVGSTQLVNDIADAHERDLASHLVGGALAPLRLHLLAVSVAAGIIGGLCLWAHRRVR